MKKFLSCKLLIFGFIFMKGVLCRNHDLNTKDNLGKIVGGYEIDIKEVPYQARLVVVTDNGAHGCGGSIISKRYVLTAAHCLSGAKNAYIRVGSSYASRDGTLYMSTKFWQHPKYNNRTLDNDVGILSPDKPIVYNSNTKPITLARRGINIPAGTEVLVTGWGRTSENSKGSERLLAVRIPVVSNEDCRQNYTYISDNMMCAGVPEGGKSTCMGDSGGPAQSKLGQVGIVSFFIGCALPGYPGAYARVSDPGVRDWIKRIAKKKQVSVLTCEFTLSYETMKKFSSYKFLIFGFLFIKGFSCRNRDLDTKDNVEKIIGGYETDIKDVPYQARLTMITDNGAYGCGGSIISQRYVLTAAHCLSGAKTVYVRVGSNYAGREGELYTSTRFWQHPKYNNRTLDNDVGIVSPNKPIVYNSNTKPITLARRGINIPAGTEVLVTGWGLTSENGQGSDKLRAVRVPVVSNEDCRQNYTYISDNMMCAGVPEGGKSACSGDSGGPAQSNLGQVGVVSFGIGCALPGYPGAFARVSSPSIRNWIRRIAKV
ncbi:CLIP domain-containing serine protease B8-like [Maniola jurtina]|uniref:CLIP domain-containing serine protease B8-like n=1 Tax=Maniola jurtina TaxID=191418 RepID=UPI001E68DE9B|nr:CLIP domain-containing serine protease B8-like [Maniola jurtina]